MFLVSNIIIAIAQILDAVLSVYFWIVIAAVVLSWVNPDPYNPVVRTIYRLTEPVLYRIRKWIPFTMMGSLDLSPVVLLLGLQLANTIIVQSLFQLAVRLG